MKKVLITGSEGFVGQHLVSILKDDYQIIGLSRNTQLVSGGNIRYEIGDLLDVEFINSLIEKYLPDVIIHLAGIAKSWGNDPKQVFDINLFGTLNIYEAILKLKSDSFNPKIIFISSAEVYGNTKDPSRIKEDDILNPINSYGTSKLAADRLSYQYSKAHNLNITVLRPFPHIGPGQQKGFFVPDMASQIVEIENNPNKNEILVGNLSGIRDYLDVRDVVKAYKLAIETDLPNSESYNICSGTPIKIADILEKLTKLTNEKINIKEDAERLRPIEISVFVGNNEKFTSATGWKPTYSLDQSLQDIMNYWRNV